MEANTTILTLILSILKWMFPALIGSLLAVWYKRNDVEWREKSTTNKFYVTLIALCTIIIGIIISWAVGGVIIQTAKFTGFEYTFLVYFLVGLTSLKLLDAVVKNIDPLLDIITKGVTDLIKGVVDSIVNRWKK